MIGATKIRVYIWKRADQPALSLWSRASALFQPSVPLVEIAPNKKCYIAIAICSENTTEYYSFNPGSSQNCGGVMNTWNDDCSRMQRTHDHQIELSAKDETLAFGRYLAALWVNNIFFNEIPWEPSHCGHKTCGTSSVEKDFSSLYIYNILLNAALEQDNPLHRLITITPDTLFPVLMSLPNSISSSIDTSENHGVLPERILYLKSKHDPKIQFEYQGMEQSLNLGIALIRVKYLDDETFGKILVGDAVTDCSRYEELSKGASAQPNRNCKK